MANSASKEIHVLEYWRILVKRRWLIFTCMAAVMATVAIGSLLQERRYTGTVRVQIERSAPNILPFEEVVTSVSDTRKDFYETQYALIQSRQVARDVIGSLGLDRHPEFRVDVPDTLAEGLTGEQVAEVRRIDRFLKHLKITPVRNSRLADISFTSRDPLLAAKIADRIAESYIAFNSQARYNTSERATASLTHQIANFQEEIDAKEKELQEYARKHGIIPISETQSITLKKLNDLSDAYSRAQGERIEAEARFVALSGVGPADLPEVGQSPVVQQLAVKLAELERSYGKSSENYKPDWPEMVRVRRELLETRTRLEVEEEAIFTQVLGSAQSAFQAARNEERYLEEALEALKREFQELSLLEIQYNNLKADIANRRATLEALVRRQSETNSSRELNDLAAGNVRIVDFAEVPDRPSSPDLPLNLLLGWLGGLGLGVGLGFFFEHLDKSVKLPADIPEAAEVPCIGQIPSFEVEGSRIRLIRSNGGKAPQVQQVALISHENLKSKISEAFRELRTTLLVSRPGGPPKTVLITSSQPGEGKTVVALNLAITLAQLGRRVLLVDADLRKPRMHRLLHCTNERGFTNLLSGFGPLDPQPQETAIPGLYLLPSGPLPPNPADLLDSDRFLEVQTELQASGFDHILYDSPPVLAVADPAILAGRVDAVVLVVWACITSRDALSQAVQRLGQVKGTVLGGVLNQVDLSQQGYYFYRYNPYYAREEDLKEPRGGDEEPGKRVESAGGR